MERFQKHAERFETEIIFDQVVSAHLGEPPCACEGDAATYTCDALVIATGASARYLGMESEKQFMGKRRLRLCHLRRFFLQEATGRCHRRRNTAVEKPCISAISPAR